MSERFTHYDLGYQQGGAVVQVTLQDNAAIGGQARAKYRNAHSRGDRRGNYRSHSRRLTAGAQSEIVAEIEAEQRLVEGTRQLIERMKQKITATLARIWGEEQPEPAAAEE